MSNIVGRFSERYDTFVQKHILKVLVGTIVFGIVGVIIILVNR